MKTQKLNRYPIGATILAILLTAGFTVLVAAATPSDEIARAVSASGASDVKRATPDQYIRAFTTVLVSAKTKDIPSYVSSGVTLRPDLADQIVVAALKVARPMSGKEVVDKQLPCDWMEPIIRAAIAAAPSAKDAIVRAALASDPWARACILAAAGVKEGELALFRPPGVDAGNINSTIIGTINPGNIGGQGLPTSEEQPPAP